MELLVPPRRLGRLLSEARLEKGLTVAEVSEEMGGSLDEIDLLEIETGRRAVSESDLKTLSELYGVRTSAMVPSRSRASGAGDGSGNGPVKEAVQGHRRLPMRRLTMSRM